MVNCKDENELEQKIKNGDYDLAFVRNKAKNNDPLFFLLNFTSDSLQYQDFLNKIKLEDNMWKRENISIKHKMFWLRICIQYLFVFL